MVTTAAEINSDNATTGAIIIGSGFGGLALAIRLQAAGIPTTILEARDKPGGRAYVYEQDGFRFDAGPTVLTAPEGSDPASLAFDAMTQAEADGADLLMIDTAGRLQNRSDLMEELQKGPAVLRLSYVADVEPESLVERRMDTLKSHIMENWEALDCCYELVIEPEIYWRLDGPAARRREGER